MDLIEFNRRIPDLANKSHADRIKIFGWYLHTYSGRSDFNSTDIRKCNQTSHMGLPSSFSGYFENLNQRGELLRNKSGYRLETRIRRTLDNAYAHRSATIEVTELLLKLPDKIPDLRERTFLDEALICFRNQAFRAAIVMTWNLAYYHLCEQVLANHLADFNARWVVVYPSHHRKSPKGIVARDDFMRELKESEVIEISNSASIITKDIYKILVEKLGRRNSAAHPSSVKIEQLQAEEFIDDLVKNVVLKIS